MSEAGRTQKPQKAYKNLEFLNSPDARLIRVLAEFLEPAARFRRHRIHDTIVFFGSSRIQPPEQARDNLARVSRQLARRQLTPNERKVLQKAKTAVAMSRYYRDAMELARLLTGWSLSLGRGKRRFIVCSGGGPGIMEAANRGATLKKKGFSIGLNISIPSEQYPNRYITPDMSFEFHYFFVRKYWFLYMAKALVAFPGGFGTLDELFEVLTLIQTQKLRKKLPVVVYGKEHWNRILNLKGLLETGMIDEADLGLFHFSDTPEEAFEYLKETLTRHYIQDGDNGAPFTLPPLK